MLLSGDLIEDCSQRRVLHTGKSNDRVWTNRLATLD